VDKKKQFIENAGLVFDQTRGQSTEQERIAELERMIGRLTIEPEATKKSLLGRHVRAWSRRYQGKLSMTWFFRIQWSKFKRVS
jgi:hypothetical protein